MGAHNDARMDPHKYQRVWTRGGNPDDYYADFVDIGNDGEFVRISAGGFVRYVPIRPPQRLKEAAKQAERVGQAPVMEKQAMKLELHRCKVCGTRWLLWPAGVGGTIDASWNLLDKYSKPGSCCDNAPMGEQIEHLRDFDLGEAVRSSPSVPREQDALDPVSGLSVGVWSYEGEQHGRHRVSICAGDVHDDTHACVADAFGKTENEAHQRAEWIVSALRNAASSTEKK